jgi:hypothetical protein
MFKNALAVWRIPNHLGNEDITKERKGVWLVEKNQSVFFMLYFFIGSNYFFELIDMLRKAK